MTSERQLSNIYGHVSTFVQILSWVNIMKGKLTEVPGKLSLPQKSETAL